VKRRILGVVVAVAVLAVGCGPSETSAPRTRNAAGDSANLINGNFVAGGGGWSVFGSGVAVGAGCNSSGGDPSLGAWKKNALAFGYRRSTVSQSVLIPKPSTVVLKINGSVRDDQRDATFLVDLKSAAQGVSTGLQTGAELVNAQTFTLSVATSNPNESVTVSVTGSSSKYWAGCYGPMISNANISVTPNVSPIVVVGPSTTLVDFSTTTTISTPSSSLPLTSTTAVPPSTVPAGAVPATTIPVTTIPATTTSTSRPSTTVAQANSSVSYAIPQCVVANNANCSGTYWPKEMFERNARNATGVNFSAAVLAGSNMGGVTLSNSDFHQADLQDVVTWNSSFVNGNFVDANLNGLNIGAEFEMSALLDFRSQPRFGSLANFAGSDFSYAQISGAQLQGANFSRAIFTGANLSNSNFFGANLDGADLRTADLAGIRSGYILGKPLLPRDWTLESGYLIGPGADLSIRDAREYIDEDRNLLAIGSNASQMPGATCPIIWERSSSPMFGQQRRGYGSLSMKSFTNRNLDGVNFTGLDLRGVSFRGAKLNGAVFSATNLDSADFSNSEMQRVALDYATLKNSNFASAQWKDISSGCTTSLPTSNGVLFPSGWKLDSTASLVVVKSLTSGPGKEEAVVRHGLILGRSANLTGANIIGLDLRRVDISRATLTNVRSASIGNYYVEAKYRALPSMEFPEGWGMVDGVLVGPDANLSYADLTNLDLRRYPSLVNASLEGAFSRGGLRAGVKLPRGWAVAGGRLVGPGADLSRVQFGESKLSGAVLDGADLSGSDLSRALLDGVRGRGVFTDRGTRLPVGWKIVNDTLFGPSANLDDVVADLRLNRNASTSFTGVDLRQASLKNIALSGVTGSPLLPPRWKVVDGYLIGPTAVVPYSQIRSIASVSQENLPAGYVKFADGIAGPNMSFSRFVPRELTNVDISGSSFVGSDLRAIRMTNVRGENLDIVDVKLPPAWRYVSKPNGGVLVGPSANLARLDLSFTNLTNIDLSNADLTGARGRFVTVNESTRLPRGWRVVSGTLFGPTADLSGANLSGLDLSDLELSGATLTDARGTNIRREPRSLPDRWTIINDNLVGPTTNLICSTRERGFSCNSRKVQRSGAG
jgi:uncharacterized protein YjbI with pentapeptide repeats